MQTDEIAKLREKARFCRAQARISILPGAAAAFENMANLFEQDADELERKRTRVRRTPIL